MAKLSSIIIPQTAISPRKPDVIIRPEKLDVVTGRRRPLQNNKTRGTRSLRSLPNSIPEGRRAPVEDAQGKDVIVGPQTGAATFQDALEALHRRFDSTDQTLAYIKEEMASLRSKIPLEPVERPGVAAVSQPPADGEALPATIVDPDLGRVMLHFRGLAHRSIQNLRHFYSTLGIPSQAVEFTSFLGTAGVAELVVLESFADSVVKKLAAVKVNLDVTFDPLLSPCQGY